MVTTPALLYRRQISTSTADASTAADSTTATSTLDAEAREINFAEAGHDSDDDSDDDSDEDSTPTEDARSHNLLSPTRRNTNANESSESPKDDSLDDLRLEGDNAFDETRVLYNCFELHCVVVHNCDQFGNTVSF